MMDCKLEDDYKGKWLFWREEVTEEEIILHI